MDNDFIKDIKYAILDFDSRACVWNKLIKRNIIEKIEFPKYGYAEDKYITTQVLFFSKDIGYVDSALYHYQYNQSSWMNNSKKERDRYIGLLNNFRNILDFLRIEYGKNLSIFEPELGKRIQSIQDINPNKPKNIVKKILRIIIPVKAWREKIRIIYNNIKSIL